MKLLLAALVTLSSLSITEGALADEAEDLLRAGRASEACAKLEAELVRGPSSLELLVRAARCHELTGKTKTAWARATEASLLPGANPEAAELAARLAVRLANVRLDVFAPKPEQTVLLDGAPVPHDRFGVLIPVDAGPHVVSWTGPDGAGERRFVIQDRGAEVVVIGGPTGPGADSLAAPPAAPTGGSTGSTKVLPSPAPLEGSTLPGGSASSVSVAPDGVPADSPASSDGVTRTVDPLGLAAFFTTGAGIVGLGTGIAFGVMTLVEVGEAEDDPRLCPGKVCSPAGRVAIDEAESKGIVSTVAFSVGGIALATGVGLFLYKELGITTPVKPTVGAGSIGILGEF